MKVDGELKRKVLFVDLKWGDCFLAKTRNNGIFIKIPMVSLYEGGGNCNAVTLETGLLACFPSNEQVEPLPNAKVVI